MRQPNENERRAWRDKAEARLAKMEADIEGFKAGALEAHADARMEKEKQVAELEEKRGDYSEKLAAARESGGEAWRELSAGAEAAWNELADAFDRARRSIS